MSDNVRVHIQQVSITFTCEDENLDAMDRLNERIKTFITEEITEENSDGRYDGIALMVEGTHRDIEVDPEELDALMDERRLEDASLFPPPSDDRLLN